TEFNVTCRYGGVFHVEKNGRYSLTRSEAVELCRALNSTLATLEQVKKANELGFETCRYGFVVGHVVIPRVKPYHLCAANHTGVYSLLTNTTGRYDAYCYNGTEARNKTCDPIESLDTSLLTTQDEIVIDNADGSHFKVDGTRHGGETSGADDDSVGSGSTHDTTPMDTSIRRSSPSYYGSATPASQLPDHSSGGGEKEIPIRYPGDEVSPVSSAFPLVTETDDSPSRAAGPDPASTRSTSSNHGNQGPRKGYSDPTASPGETTTTTTIVSQPRSAQLPEWLIIVAALLALALILAVCIAVNSRRRCGQKKKLVINNGKGAVEDRKTSGLNGDASSSQEMVHLVHKEQSSHRPGACDEFLTVNETQNHQELDMKSGV
ncbi:CD44 antigen, partial [Dryobates pubescens]